MCRRRGSPGGKKRKAIALMDQETFAQRNIEKVEIQGGLGSPGPGRGSTAPGPGDLWARVSGRTAEHGEAGEFPAGVEAGRRAVVVSAPVADAGFLGIPDGVHGLEPADGD